MISHIQGKLVEKKPTNVIIDCGGVGFHLNIVSGIGSSTARTMLSSLTPKQVREGIAVGDVALIQSIKGIGAKTAQRVILDLKDKILKVYDIDENSALESNTSKDEALSALEVLGFMKKQSERVIDKILSQEPNADVETIIKLALKNL